MTITRIQRRIELNLSSTWVELKFNFTAKVELNANCGIYRQLFSESSSEFNPTESYSVKGEVYIDFHIWG